MSSRHLSRSIALQTLFELEFTDGKAKQADKLIEKNIKEFGPGLESDAFVKNIVKGVLKKQKEINKIIEKAAPDWPIDQIARVDRNVLRIGLYELLFADRKEVPPKVAINEAIELAKAFGGDSSGKFVNGVLGTVYRELGEPGKDDSPKKKQVADPSKLPKEELGGAVLYRKEKDKTFFALVHDVFGYWTLSKSKLQDKEDFKKGTLRALEKELGLKKVKLGQKIGTNEYIASDPEKGPLRKIATIFLAETKEKELKLGESGGLDDVGWFTYEEIQELKIYDDIKELLKKANEKI